MEKSQIQKLLDDMASSDAFESKKLADQIEKGFDELLKKQKTQARLKQPPEELNNHD